METMLAIMTRRSVRVWTEEKVSEQLQKDLLAAAMQAPSAGNCQPWQIVVLDDPRLLATVARGNPDAGMADQAPLGFMVCGDLKLSKFGDMWVQDCSAMTQNLLLAAHALGLGAVWTGAYPDEEKVRRYQELCALPAHVVPLALVLVGYPRKQPAAVDRYQSDRVHRNTWKSRDIPK